MNLYFTFITKIINVTGTLYVYVLNVIVGVFFFLHDIHNQVFHREIVVLRYIHSVCVFGGIECVYTSCSTHYSKNIELDFLKQIELVNIRIR